MELSNSKRLLYSASYVTTQLTPEDQRRIDQFPGGGEGSAVGAKPDATVELEFHGSGSSGRLQVPGALTKMVIEEARTRASRPELSK
jgi:hypothetical protein